ncbi:MAG: hypothetical protein KDK78_10085 [Chlamydiia bacterium]|nr:hypothetical protein [Chlamydiia bacterium]
MNRSNDSLLGEWGLTKRQSRLAVAGIGLTVATGVLGILTGAAGLLTPTPLGVVAFPLMVILAVSTVLTATAAMLAGGGLFVTSMLDIRKGLKGKQGAEAEEMGRFLKNYDIHEPSRLEVIKESIKSVVGGLYQRIFG